MASSFMHVDLRGERSRCILEEDGIVIIGSTLLKYFIFASLQILGC